MMYTICPSLRFRASSRNRILPGCCILLVVFGLALARPALADGCFVFRWNKQIDINEPTQKAIIVYDAGREDLLLQVKYDGPLDEFGWLIPVPSLPTVEKGSMEPFYELSQLTQKQYGDVVFASLRSSTMGLGKEAVKVVEIKTVGAYEVAVLSAQDADSLGRWLKAHDYSLPDGKQEIIDEYIRKNWYFVAAKIQLNKKVAFRRVSNDSRKDAAAPAREREALQKQLSTGELHPLLISFDTPRCIFPLRISAVGGKPSEVSIYVLSAEPLLEKTVYDKAVQKARQQEAELDSQKTRTEEVRRSAMRNLGVLGLANQLNRLSASEPVLQRARDWSVNDVKAMAQEEDNSPMPPFEDDFYRYAASPYEALAITPAQIPKCIKGLPRLDRRNWFLTKQVSTFKPEEMHDLEFQPALPILQAALPTPEGGMAATMLWHYGGRAVPILISACQSTNPTERLNASGMLQSFDDPRLTETILALLKDDQPGVRYYAVMAAAGKNPKFTDPLLALFRDPVPRIRWLASLWLSSREPASRAPVYVALLKDPDPNVQYCAFLVLLRIAPKSIPREHLLSLLSSPQLETVTQALNVLQGNSWLRPISFPNAPVNSKPDVKPLSSDETAPLTTNRFTLARLMGLKILLDNADAPAVEMTLPLLRDTNTLVRNRAFSLLRSVSGEDISQSDPAKWEQWWAANKASFAPRKPSR